MQLEICAYCQFTLTSPRTRVFIQDGNDKRSIGFAQQCTNCSNLGRMYNKPDERQQAKFIVSTDRNCYLETDDIAEISDFLMQLVSQPFEASVNFGRHMHSFCTFSHKKSVIYPGELLLTINCVVNNFEDKNIALKDKVENVFGYTRPESTKTIRPLVHKILSDLEERYKTHLAIEDVRTVQKQREEGLIS